MKKKIVWLVRANSENTARVAGLRLSAAAEATTAATATATATVAVQ